LGQVQPASFLATPSSGLILSDYLVRMDNIVKILALRYSESSIVVVGKNGVLYANVDDSMTDYRGLVPYSESQLAYLLGLVKSERDYLKSKGIGLLLVVVPNKESVYPEFLPDDIKKINPTTHLDQIEEYFNKNSDIRFLDLKPTFMAAKQTQQIYYKTDSHWNSYGAFLAYGKIMEALGIKPHSITDYDFIPNPDENGDLSKVLKMSDIYAEPIGHRQLKDGIVSEKLPCAVVIHDSFYGDTDLKTLMAPHFDRVVDIRYGQLTLFSSEMIEREKPSVVIYIMVERVVGRYFMPWH